MVWFVLEYTAEQQLIRRKNKELLEQADTVTLGDRRKNKEFWKTVKI